MNRLNNEVNTHIFTRDEFVQKFSFKLDKLMRSKHITDCEVADKVGCSVSTINSYRNGRSLPDAYTLHRLVKAIPCTIDALTIF